VAGTPRGPHASSAPSWRTPVAGGLAALFWCLTCIRWFDDGAPYRPWWLASIPPALPALLTLGALLFWLQGRSRALWGTTAGQGAGLVLVTALAVLFRLPLVSFGAAGYTTPDGALSGIVALHAQAGTGHHVFIPGIPYSGSLKSHLTVLLALLTDLPRAFTLASVLFYGVFVAGVYRLALLADGGRFTPLAAGLYLAFSPAFVTHYSLSNDGNYMEVLAFGTWALFLIVRWVGEEPERKTLALGAGLLLGLAFWAHLLSIMHAATVGLVVIGVGRFRAAPSCLWLLLGFGLGFFPGVLWNLGHSWDSLAYVIPGAHTMRSVALGPSLAWRAWLMATEQWPILMGYDPGYPRLLDRCLFGVGVLGALLVLAGAWKAARENGPVLGVLLLFAIVDLVVATVALPYVPQNPRYILFLMTPIPILLARLLGGGRRRWIMALLVSTGALASLLQAPDKIAEDRRWRRFVLDLEREGVSACYTDFYLASKIDFLSGERITCCSKLGPTFTEYFPEYRPKVESAPDAALIAVNGSAAEKLSRRLDRLQVLYERRDLMKPTFVRLSRKVDPEELFPEKVFPAR
jgi:hypothetical protein